jgi:hypothetical protein
MSKRRDFLNKAYNDNFFKNKEEAIEYYFASGGASKCRTSTEKNSTLMEQIVIEDK